MQIITADEAAGLLRDRMTVSASGYAIGKALRGPGLQETGSIAARFGAPVFPGDAIAVHIWQEGTGVRCKVRVPARDATVPDNGTATVQ